MGVMMYVLVEVVNIGLLAHPPSNVDGSLSVTILAIAVAQLPLPIIPIRLFSIVQTYETNKKGVHF